MERFELCLTDWIPEWAGEAEIGSGRERNQD
jgi:hypothetical protein